MLSDGTNKISKKKYWSRYNTFTSKSDFYSNRNINPRTMEKMM